MAVTIEATQCTCLLFEQERPPPLITQLPTRPRSDSQEDAPQSVIHVPAGFKDFKEGHSNQASPNNDRAGPGIHSPATPEASLIPVDKVCLA